MIASQPIGIFDSGIGGLTVASAIRRVLPNEQIIYFGDTAHMPYGDKSPEAIKYYSLKIGKFLKEKGCKVIVIACNTASSLGFQDLKVYCCT
jgi:glutamate racemase